MTNDEIYRTLTTRRTSNPNYQQLVPSESSLARFLVADRNKPDKSPLEQIREAYWNKPYTAPEPTFAEILILDLQLEWFYKDGSDQYYELHSVRLDNPFLFGFRGVYIIWQIFLGISPEAIYVGQGDIKERLRVHRSDARFDPYFSPEKPLLVTWAEVPPRYIEGVEKYLYEKLTPIVGENRSRALSIPVNLPE